MNNKYTDRELQLLEHIATLTGAIEDVLSDLEEMGRCSSALSALMSTHIKRLLKPALDAVWEDEELER